MITISVLGGDINMFRHFTAEAVRRKDPPATPRVPLAVTPHSAHRARW